MIIVIINEFAANIKGNCEVTHLNNLKQLHQAFQIAVTFSFPGKQLLEKELLQNRAQEHKHKAY